MSLNNAEIDADPAEFSKTTELTGGAVVHIYPYDKKCSMDQLENPLSNKPYKSIKRVHIIRHAEGTHNVNREYRDIINLDAKLTPRGKDQCMNMAKTLMDATAAAATTRGSNKEERSSALVDVVEKTQLVVTSPLTRCIQTARLSFPMLLMNNSKIPFVALESIRETVNYACDRRRNIQDLEDELVQGLDLSEITTQNDEIWDSYLRRLGPPDSFDGHRESAELHVVARRGRSFFQWLANRSETDVVVCTHSAFLRCILNWGLTGGVPDMMEQTLDQRQDKPMQECPVIYFQKDDTDDFEAYIRSDFQNCELRSFVAAFP